MLWNTMLYNTRIKPILWLSMPKNAHTWMILHFFCVQSYKTNKQTKSTYLPSRFSGQKGKQIFYFLGLLFKVSLWISFSVYVFLCPCLLDPPLTLLLLRVFPKHIFLRGGGLLQPPLDYQYWRSYNPKFTTSSGVARGGAGGAMAPPLIWSVG